MATTPILPYITAPAERKNFLDAINLISLGEHHQPLPNLNLPSNSLPEAINLASTLILLNTTNQTQPPAHPLQTNIETGLKAARFFTALLRFMLQGPPDVLEGVIPYPCKNIIAFAHTMLATDKDAPGITACARVMKPEVVHKTVTGLIARRRASLKQFDVVGGMAALYERPLSGDADMESRAKALESGEKVQSLREVIAEF
jgi:hypothetical protein